MNDTQEYQTILVRLVDKFGGEISKKVKHEGIHDLYDHGIVNLPRWYKYFDRVMVMFDFFENRMYKLDVTLAPPHLLLVKPHSFFTKILGGSGKIGNDEFDRNYCIQNTSSENAKRTLNPEALTRLMTFHPFMSFKLTVREYQLCKEISLNDDFDADTAIANIERFVALVQYIHENIWDQKSGIDLSKDTI